MLCGLSCCLAYLGGIAALLVAFQFAAWIRIAFFVKCDLRKRYGAASWAVVTGASDGIGRSFALQIAKRGLNVVLVSRTKSKLDAVASEIATAYPKVQTRTIAFDFSTATATDYDTLLKKDLASLDIALLVNNVGVNTEIPTPFDEVTSEDYARFVKVNIDAANILTRGLLPDMKKRGKAGIINLSSMSGTLAFPYLTVYAATKAYNRLFSLSLSQELAAARIDVVAVQPGIVTTAMSKVKRTSFMNVAPGPMASQVLNKLSFTDETSGHWQHDVIVFLSQFVPTSTLARSVLQTRAAGLRKLAKAK